MNIADMTNADNVFWWVEDNGADFVIVMAPLPAALLLPTAKVPPLSEKPPGASLRALDFGYAFYLELPDGGARFA